MDKSPDAFRTISEVAEVLDTPAHVLRFWESRFPQVRPVKRAGGRRYYRPSDVALLAGIKRLLHDEGLTIRGVQKMLRDQGVRHVVGLAGETTPVEGSTQAAEIASGSGNDAGSREEAVPAGVIGVEESDHDLPPAAKPVSTTRPTPVQPPLPLFDSVAEPELAATTAAAPAVRPVREDATVAGLARAYAARHGGGASTEIVALARRLVVLRATLAERADGIG
jgi:DNA-binding transcriptional MerR regulator